jgi:hypothetical protein
LSLTGLKPAETLQSNIGKTHSQAIKYVDDTVMDILFGFFVENILPI